jgi:hypothetical protein
MEMLEKSLWPEEPEGDVDSGWKHNTVVRPARECIKLFEIEETSFAKNMKDIKMKSEEILIWRKDPESELFSLDYFLEIASDVPTLKPEKKGNKLEQEKEAEKLSFETCKKVFWRL